MKKVTITAKIYSYALKNHKFIPQNLRQTLVKRGFHIHQFGDLRNGCTSAGPHFNPTSSDHGDYNTSVRHAGDIGNIEFPSDLDFEKDFDDFSRTIEGISLNPASSKSVIGRTFVLHASVDDLGVTDHELSKTTGNAGGRFACGVIGLVKP